VSLKQVSDGLAKYWAIILAFLTLAGMATKAYADIQDLKVKQHSTEERMVRIEWYLVKIGTKLGVDFSEK